MTRSVAGLLLVVALIAGAGLGVAAAFVVGSSAPEERAPVAADVSPSPSTSAAEASAAPNSAAPNSAAPSTVAPPGSASPPSTPTHVAATPQPTPVLVRAPLDGLLVTPEQAARHPIAVMVDDLGPARPQSGFSAASVVWHAPAEGGIPRYMMVFGETRPSSVGPVRSSRYYYIAWAAEWRAMYVHVGGSPQALQALGAQGHGQLVYNADEFRFGGHYLWRIVTRSAPHNVYTDAGHLEELALIVGATDAPTDKPPSPVWQFAPDPPLALRPVGGHIEVDYPANTVRYDYDRASNAYLRSVSGEGPQFDAATGQRVAPRNVVIIQMHFGPLNDGHPQKRRLEADVIGSG
ncbi:MAG TPA: DUF3048 domain-containing protein, partial [Candidatus Limnocylindrales bacterium]